MDLFIETQRCHLSFYALIICTADVPADVYMNILPGQSHRDDPSHCAYSGLLYVSAKASVRIMYAANGDKASRRHLRGNGIIRAFVFLLIAMSAFIYHVT